MTSLSPSTGRTKPWNEMRARAMRGHETSVPTSSGRATMRDEECGHRGSPRQPDVPWLVLHAWLSEAREVEAKPARRAETGHAAEARNASLGCAAR